MKKKKKREFETTCFGHEENGLAGLAAAILLRRVSRLNWSGVFAIPYKTSSIFFFAKLVKSKNAISEKWREQGREN